MPLKHLATNAVFVPEMQFGSSESRNRFASLTPRQHQIMQLVIAGHPSKNIAMDLGISQRTVENHRAVIMQKTYSKCLPELVRLAFSAGWNGGDELVKSH